MKLVSVLLPIVCFATISCKREKAVSEASSPLFLKRTAEHTGVDFVNRIAADIHSNFNVFDFDYFYNGSGVATVDINNDGLLDLLFTANQESNRLYLNKGGLRFKDITDWSGINSKAGWSTGVSFADVNGDGWQDLYISQGGPSIGDSSTNLLFINQQNLTFKESAKSHGLDDESLSSQSAFFDYDKDGDLDCIVMNENVLFGSDPNFFYRLIESDEQIKYESSSHLYRNDDGFFTDVTKESGLLSATFGLGLIVSDINEDNWLDIYIANDYYVPDALYLNQGDGTFSNEIENLTDQVSFFGMGVDIADVTSDLLQDIFVLDMASSDHYRSKTLMASMDVDAFDLLINGLGLHHQYMFNSLQVNTNGHFKNVAQLTKMAKTDWSWAVLLNDFDNDTRTDVYITNGYRKYALNNDIRMEILAAKKKYAGNVPIQIKEQIYSRLPSEKLANVMFKNEGDLSFTEMGARWGISDPSFSNGAAYADLDNDGDLDLVVNNIDDPAFIYENQASDLRMGNFVRVATKGTLGHSYAKVTVYAGESVQKKESNSVRGYLSALDPTVHFGLGVTEKVDSIRVEWISGFSETKVGVEVNEVVTFYESNAGSVSPRSLLKGSQMRILTSAELGIDFVHHENDFNDFQEETLLPYKQSTLGPSLAVGDVNGDNLDDFFIGGALSQSGRLYLQTTDARFIDITPMAFTEDAIYEDMDAVFVDVDNDGDEDLFVVSGGYEFEKGSEAYTDRLYINDGFGGLQRAVNTSLDLHTHSGRTVAVLDFDKDGLQDLVVGNRVEPGRYPQAPSSILYRNTGSDFVNLTEERFPELLDFGMVNKVLATDFNQDGWDDLVVVGEWTRIGMFENQAGSFQEISDSDKETWSDLRGWWFSISETDVNNDGRPDYVIGNLGLNSKYKATKKSPLKIFASDFDENSTWDIVLSNSYQGNYVPLRGRECSSNQMPFIAKQFPTYDLFAKATIEDIYGDDLKDAYQRYANEFRSLSLLNLGDGRFEATYLPNHAQVAPILDSETIDQNNDGNEDLFILGTIYNTEVETPRLDAGSGDLFIGKESGEFLKTAIPFRIDGNLKSVVKLKIGTKDCLIIGRNDSAPVILVYGEERTL